MKFIQIILVTSFLALTAMAQTILPSIFVKASETYVGQEYINQQATRAVSSLEM